MIVIILNSVLFILICISSYMTHKVYSTYERNKNAYKGIIENQKRIIQIQDELLKNKPHSL